MPDCNYSYFVAGSTFNFYPAQDVFVPSSEDRLAKSTVVRFQYAHFIYGHGGGWDPNVDPPDAILAPPEFSSDEAAMSDPFGVAVIPTSASILGGIEWVCGLEKTLYLSYSSPGRPGNC